MTKENEIKPLACPFCGDLRTEIHKEPLEPMCEGDSDHGHWVECCRCAARGPLEDSLKDPMPSWNRRTNPELDELRKILMEIRSDLSCRCDPAYTSRSMHEPNSFCYWLPYIDADLKQKEG